MSSVRYNLCCMEAKKMLGSQFTLHLGNLKGNHWGGWSVPTERCREIPTEGKAKKLEFKTEED